MAYCYNTCYITVYYTTILQHHIRGWYHKVTHSLSCPSMLLNTSTAVCLPPVAGDENKLCLLGLGALEPLCELVTHQDKLVRRNALMALGIMATNGE